MRRTAFTLGVALAGLLSIPATASALTAVTTAPLPLRAGPAADFPIVDRLPGDARVVVHGCVRAYRWCDVSWRDAHGWIRGDELAYLEGQRRVSIIEYGPRVHLPIVTFSVDRYWDRYYRSRPFYSERTRWRTTWRDHDRREGSFRGSNRQERLKDARGFRSMDREEGRRTERKEQLKENRANRNIGGDNDRRTERKEELKDSRGFRSMDRGNDRRAQPKDQLKDTRGYRSTDGGGNAAGQGGRPEAGGQQRSSPSATGGQRGGNHGHGSPGAAEGAKRP